MTWRSGLQQRLGQVILARFWYLHPPLVMLVEGDAEDIRQQLKEATKPSKDRLHLQELFVEGRRYRLEARRRGFTLMTNSKQYWRYIEGVFAIRKRTRSSARLIAVLVETEIGYTRLDLYTHMRLGYWLDILWLPLFMSSIIVLVPWVWWAIALLVGLLFGLSYAYHYFNAAFQANEMTFFIEKVLKDRLVTDIPALEATNPDVLRVHNQSFGEEWERFYNAHQPDH